MAENKRLVLAYWDIQGLAHPVRYLLHYHKIDFEVKQNKERRKWFENDKQALNCDFPNLPYIKGGDVVITESITALQYAA